MYLKIKGCRIYQCGNLFEHGEELFAYLPDAGFSLSNLLAINDTRGMGMLAAIAAALECGQGARDYLEKGVFSKLDCASNSPARRACCHRFRSPREHTDELCGILRGELNQY